MTIQPFRVALIGGGINSAAGYAHYCAMTLDGIFNVVTGSFSRNADINAATAKRYGVETKRVWNDWKEALKHEQGSFDIVVVLTPTPSHHAIVRYCILNGFPVICEKALVANAEDADDLLQITKEKKGFLAVTYNYTGYPMLRELKKMISDGRLGKIIHFQALMPQEGFLRKDSRGNKPKPQQWRLTDDRIPVIHLDLAVHLHEIIYYLTGLKPCEVISDHSSKGFFENVTDNVECLAKYEDDVRGHFWFSKSALGYRNGLEVEIFGTEASAKWVQGNPEEMIVSYADGARIIADRGYSGVTIANEERYTRFKAGHPAGFIEAFANVYRDIASAFACYQNTKTWSSDEVFGVELVFDGMLFLKAMVNSVNSKKWEKITYVR
ncbi:MAG: Gfo/Idh/MocA family oxidoreductase [Deferribacteraceae bacterium]|jgi:predicted dehydrogenase|nr:Gfo/Idh/MocA family oxidoreductase [Deferribacteraceae bacterium]